MTDAVVKAPPASLAQNPGGVVEMLRIPQITLHAFCETSELTGTMKMVVADRRMARARAKVYPGGIAAAIELYRQTASPNLVVVESSGTVADLHIRLDELADVCVQGTKLVVIGYANDIAHYRALLARGVSDYVVAPIDPIAMIGVIGGLYHDTQAKKLGRSLAFIGASGGSGSSTIAHNVASILGRTFGSDVILADLDLPFGSVSLGFNLEPAPGMAQALQDTNRLDYALLERLLHKCEDHLAVLTAPATLDSPYDLEESTFEQLLEISLANVPFVVLDVPHVWTSWVKKTLLTADEVVITASPDLVSLRNSHNLVDQLKRARPNDAPPRLVLNQVGVPKRSEIAPAKFAAALQIEPIACIPFESATVSAAANKGQMIADAAPKSVVTRNLMLIAQSLAGRTGAPPDVKSRFALNRLWKK